MRARATLLLLLTSLALGSCTTMQGPPRLALALTIDDLPVHGPVPQGDTPVGVANRLITGLKTGGSVPVVGFVNGKWTDDDPATAAVLGEWRRAGFALGNHGWSHRNLNDLTPAEFTAELTRNEPLLRRYAAGSDWRWFRYPFLAEGNDPARRNAARQELAGRGYRVAAVTMDFSDWQWTGPYARCVAAGNAVGVRGLEQRYLEAAGAAVARSRQFSQAVHGRDIPYVLLLHGGAFTAHMMPRLLKLYRDQGFGFVSLAEASRDPAYAAAVDPARPGPPATLEGRAAAVGLPVPPAPDVAADLARLCA